ncbi:glycosyltransferase [Pseudomonas sp. N040]|uniref:glycosyltransferase n=1 Tax=Pseudomonas sp. N040 TaxID=2785325 RepID=UPI0018A2776A|nr:glycosyltransferase [Pseudomonas sp. N040]MBF7729327.1 glycosyltransferase [Pseudomonas sp. N040]MBW7012967.1 glycosyltransferase [Pseudomonas sp. N040]
MQLQTAAAAPVACTTALLAHPIAKMRKPVQATAPKVCHIAATTEGAKWVFEQLRDLRDRHGYEVAVILNGLEGELVDRFRAAGITVFASNFDFTSNADLLSLPRKVVQLVRLLKRERFDVVQTHLFHSMVIGRIAAWFSDVPVRLSMIAGPFHLEADTPRWIDRYTQWLDTTIIASCEFTRSLYQQMGVPPERLSVIYYGPDETRFNPDAVSPADLRAEYGWGAETRLIGMIAYFYPELPVNRWIPRQVQGRSVKSQEDLVRALPLILERYPQAKVLFVGSGWEQGGREYLEKMQALVLKLGLDQSVVFAGFRTDISAVLRGLDVAVQCSLSENLGGTIESLLMACPTVATRVGGMVDSVVDGQTGVLVEPANPRSLAEGVMRLLQDPEAARAIGIAGRQRMLAGFTLRHTVERLAELYASKIAQAPAGYRPLVTVYRLMLGGALCLIIVLRYCLFDAYLLRKWDLGLRPWQLKAWIQPLRTLLYRVYAFIGRHPTNFGIRRRLRKWLGRA